MTKVAALKMTDTRSGTRNAAADDLARRVAERMFANDEASRALGIEIVRLGPGSAEVTMRVRPEMLNGHGTCHGGLIFALADSAFALACNTHDHVTVASGCGIDFVQPAHAGDVLMATAEERALAGRTGVYDVTVVNERGKTVALFRGKSHRIQGHVVPESSSSGAPGPSTKSAEPPLNQR
jgi:acyl-CoA thioesterase